MNSKYLILAGVVLFAICFPAITFAIVAAGGLAFMSYMGYVKFQFERFFPSLGLNVQEAYELTMKDVTTFFVRVRNRLGR